MNLHIRWSTLLAMEMQLTTRNNTFYQNLDHDNKDVKELEYAPTVMIETNKNAKCGRSCGPLVADDVLKSSCRSKQDWSTDTAGHQFLTTLRNSLQ